MLQIHGFTGLTRLAISKSYPVSAITISDLPIVTYVEVGATYGCGTAILRRLPRLQHLQIDGDLDEIDIAGAPSLCRLTLVDEKQPAARVQLSDVAAVTILDARNIELPAAAWLALPNLKQIELHNVMPAMSGPQWSGLQSANLSWTGSDAARNWAGVVRDARATRRDEVDLAIHWQDVPTFDNLNSLRISIEGPGRFPSIWPAMPKLQWLEILCGQLDHKLSLREMPLLQSLRIQGVGDWNRLAVADLPSLTSLQVGTTHACPQVELRRLPALQQASFLFGRLDSMSVSDVQALTKLSIFSEGGAENADALPGAGNPAAQSRLRLSNAGMLGWLNLTNVELADDDWGALPKLEYLSLRNSAEPQLSPHQWSQLKRLELSKTELSWRTAVGLLFASSLQDGSINLATAGK